jgi:hypothetical protein
MEGRRCAGVQMPGYKVCTVGLILVTAVLVLLVYPPRFSAVDSSASMANRPPTSRTGPSGADDACTFNTFKKYVTANTFYPDQGSWTFRKGISKHFRPDICKFKYNDRTLPKYYVNQCLLKKNITKVLILGDSQGSKYYKATVRLLARSAGYKCQLIKREVIKSHFYSDARYFANGTKLALGSIHTRKHREDYCWCQSRLWQCTNGLGARRLQVEFLPMIKYRDNHTTSDKSQTSQEFYFMEYLRDNYPDVIFLFGNHHYRWIRNVQEAQISMHMLAGILKVTVPRRTPVIWLTTTTEKHEKHSKEHRDQLWYGAGGRVYTRPEFFSSLNKAVFNTLQPLMVGEHSNFLPFLDLQSMSRGVLDELVQDAIHFQDKWYNLIVSYLLQTLCESDLDELLGKPQSGGH